MKYCVSYKVNTDILHDADEIRFSSFNEIFSLREEEWFQSKRAILEILDYSQLTLNNQSMTGEMMGSLLLGMDNLFLDFYLLDDLIEFSNQTDGAYDNRCMFHYPVDTYNLVNMLLSRHVSDIAIDEPLAFDIVNLEHYIHYDNPTCRIRIRPYIGRNAWMAPGEDLCHFWVLPQHIKFYEPYVYAIDILANNTMREEALYRIYKSGKYDLDMAALIEHFDNDPQINALWIDDGMAQHRLTCRQICQSTKPKRCHMCYLQGQMLKVMPRARYKYGNKTESQS